MLEGSKEGMTPLSPTGFLTIGDAKLEYRLAGGAGAPPTIVMLHEGLGSAALWGDFPDRLAAATGAGVFAYSRAGYGASSPATLPRPLTYMRDEALQVLPPLLDAIGFRRGLLLGHSDGASIATIYAGGVQDHRVRGLILIAPHFIVEDVSLASPRPRPPTRTAISARVSPAGTDMSTSRSAAGTTPGSTPASAPGTFPTRSPMSGCRSRSCRARAMSTARSARSRSRRRSATARSR